MCSLTKNFPSMTLVSLFYSVLLKIHVCEVKCLYKDVEYLNRAY